MVELRGWWLRVRKKLWSGGDGEKDLGSNLDPSGDLHL